MIKVNISTVPGSTGFNISGHAEFAEHGLDIVCASVSAISQTTLYGLMLYSTIEYTKHSGYLDVHIKTPNDITDALINAMIHGISDISKQAPENVSIMFDELVEVTEKL
jgi:uncharacterized protein